MGGQACILYGAAEFSRDTDLAVLASPGNLARLRSALADLRAEVIAVPPFEAKYLRRGHAVHFRCHHPEAPGMCVDVMTRLLEADYFRQRSTPSARQVRFWLRELRTPELLVEAAERWPAACARLKERRPLLRMARPG